jgi:hypothetical protein
MTAEQRNTQLTDAYRGPATIVTTRGEIPVTADLFLEPADLAPESGAGSESASRAWSGRIETAQDINIFTVATGPCTLRLPNGRESTVLPGIVTVGTGVIPVTGTGPAPFADV